MKWNFEDSILAASDSNGIIRIYSSPSFDILKVLSHRTASLMPITSMSWYPDSKNESMKDTLLANTSDGWLMLWQTTIGILLQSAQLPEKQATVCEFSPQGDVFAVSCRDFSIAIYNAASFEMEYTLDFAVGNVLGHSNKIFALKWLDSTTLISGGWDETVLVWNLSSRSVSNYFYGLHICGQSIDLRENMLLVGIYGMKKQIQMFNIENS